MTSLSGVGLRSRRDAPDEPGVVLIVWVPYRRSFIGRAAYAVGSSEQAAFMSVVRVFRPRLSVSSTGQSNHIRICADLRANPETYLRATAGLNDISVLSESRFGAQSSR